MKYTTILLALLMLACKSTSVHHPQNVTGPLHTMLIEFRNYDGVEQAVRKASESVPFYEVRAGENPDIVVISLNVHTCTQHAVNELASSLAAINGVLRVVVK